MRAGATLRARQQGPDSVHRFHFIHAAGLHLAEPFGGVGRVPAPVQSVLSQASLAAWDDLVECCIGKDAAFLIIAGGICSRQAGTIAGRMRLRRGLKRLADHHIKCFLALRSTDDDAVDVVSDLRASEITIFPADAPLTVRIEHRGEPVAWLCGQSEPVEGGIDPAAFFSTATDQFPRIGALPAAVETLEQQPEAIRRRASYWALGSAPAPSRRGFSPWIVECGALQARSNTAAERGQRGPMLVSVDGDRILAVDHVPLDRVRYAELTLVPRFALDDGLLCHQVLDELNRVRATHAGRALLVDIVLHDDRGGLGAGVELRAQATSLLQRLREETRAWDPFVWCSNLRTLPIAPASQQAADPLGKAVLEESRALLANPLQRSLTFARLFDPIMRRWTSELENDDAELLIAEATALALQQGSDDVVA